MAKPSIFIIIIVLAVQLSAQTSSLVYLGAGDKLEYTKYANVGEELVINQVPDFSWAGYQYGGVALPQVESALILEALAGDNRMLIQQAIDELSTLPPDENGFRGAILLKSGKYDCSGPLHIRESGIVLRGEGQNSPEEGGTQIHATANYQHELVSFEGVEESPLVKHPHIDTMVIEKRIIDDFNNDGIMDTIDGERWMRADITSGVAADLATGASTSVKLASNSGDYVAYHSKEGGSRPYLEVVYRPSGKDSDSTFTVMPVADAYIRGGAFSSENAGVESQLIVKNVGYNHEQTREVYMKFSVPAIDGELRSAKVLLWCLDAGDTEDVEHYVSHFSDLDWEESTITYDNQPKPGLITSNIINEVVPVGATTLIVDNSSMFQAGDSIVVLRTPNQLWIDTIGMDEFLWKPDDFIVEYERIITGVQGDLLYLDVPMVQTISANFGGGEVYKRNSGGRITNCGIEDILFTSVFTNAEDEAHAWTAVSLKETENCWVRNVTAKNFGYACVSLDRAYKTTVENCAMIDPVSLIDGDRRYSFEIAGGSFNLFQRCYTRGGRHDFVTDARVSGPNVFLDCLAEQTYSDIGPHHRYATGTLFDNIKGGHIRVWNREGIGSGHGWAGAQTMFWNLDAPSHEIVVESPVGAMNWGIGCSSDSMAGEGFWESWGIPVLPRSLYLQQLRDRLGDQAVENVTIPGQGSESLYEVLVAWRGEGDLEKMTGIDRSFISPHEISVFPNPTDGWVHIEMSGGRGPGFLIVRDMTGRTVLSREVDENSQVSLFLEAQPGLYLVEVHAEDGIAIKKIIKR